MVSEGHPCIRKSGNGLGMKIGILLKTRMNYI